MPGFEGRSRSPCEELYRDGTEIAYRVRFSRRKTIQITVFPDGTVEVAAPWRTRERHIAELVRRRAGWIRKKRARFAELGPPAPPPQYLAGEDHLYLGRAYMLNTIRASRPRVTLAETAIRIRTPEPGNREMNRRLLHRWYLRRAKATFPERLDALFPAFARRGAPQPELAIRLMRRRWGSMTAANRMTLNRDLIRAPIECLDYVITHELCHLFHRNHGRDFHTLLDQMMPDWRDRKERLERTLF